MIRIAVEGQLGNVSQYLSERGYQVVQLDPHTQTGAELRNCDAIVVSGMDSNLTGDENALTNSPVIQAKGMTPEQVHSELERRIGRAPH